MSLSIANNVGSLNARNNLARSTNSLNKSIERLSSGFKVNRGADGPAALVISEKQRAQIAGLQTAISNTEKAASVVQTAEGALNEINSILNKVRSLALDSATLVSMTVTLSQPIKLRSPTHWKRSTESQRTHSTAKSRCSTVQLASAELRAMQM